MPFGLGLSALKTSDVHSVSNNCFPVKIEDGQNCATPEVRRGTF
jgi:hypothetical protein